MWLIFEQCLLVNGEVVSLVEVIDIVPLQGTLNRCTSPHVGILKGPA